MATFVYLFRSNPNLYRSMSPEEMQQAMNKWMNWRETLEKSGHLKQRGQRLDFTGKVIRGKAKTITDGPYVEVKDSIQGLILVESETMDEALELARGCPVLEADGTVEVRPVVAT